MKKKIIITIVLMLIASFGIVIYYMMNQETNRELLKLWNLEEPSTVILEDYVDQDPQSFDGWRVSFQKYELDQLWIENALIELDNNFALVTSGQQGQIPTFMDNALSKIKGYTIRNDIRISENLSFWIYRNSENNSRIILVKDDAMQALLIISEKNYN